MVRGDLEDKKMEPQPPNFEVRRMLQPLVPSIANIHHVFLLAYRGAEKAILREYTIHHHA